MVEDRPGAPEELVSDPSPDVPQIGRPLAKVLIVDAGELVGLLGSDAVDGLCRIGAGVDRGQRRFDDPGIGGEERLRLEDRPDLVASPVRRFAGKGRQLLARRVEGRPETRLLDTGIVNGAGRHARARGRRVRARSRRR